MPQTAKEKTQYCTPYEAAGEILKITFQTYRDWGIPDYEMAAAMADFLMMNVLAMGRKNGLSEQAAEAIIQRQQNLLDDWKHGRSPFDERR